MDRRSFLRSTMYFTVVGASAGLAGCGNGGDDGNDGSPRGSYMFPQGVASGDPKDTSAVFWTRCLSRGPSTADVPLRLEVSASDRFETLAASAQLAATGVYDHTVRAKVTGLSPGTHYFYRFVAGQDSSVIGELRTAPAPSSTPAKARFAWMTCQDWSINHWGALELMLAEDLDFVVHVGDYIYESVGAAFQSGRAEPAHAAIALPDGLKQGPAVVANTLADYRTLYRTYRTDPRLQAVHARYPMIAIWDDHEFSDDCWQDHQTYTNANPRETARRRAANQAWAEYMPVDFGDVSFDLQNAAYDNIRIYRDFRFGSLMHLVMTDQRLYRDDHVIPESGLALLLGHDQAKGDDKVGSRYFVPQPLLKQFEELDTVSLKRPPSILGPTQTQWWKDTMKASTSTWKVWGNEVTLNRMWADLRTVAPPPYNNVYIVNADVWDGYPTHKAELMTYLKTQGIRNVVAITGDLHAFQCGVVRDNNDPATGTPVAVDFVCAGVSSDSFYHYLRDGAQGTPLTALVATPQAFDGLIRVNNPDFAYVDHDAQGFALAEVTAQAFTVTFHKVKPLNADGSKPAAPLLKKTRITLAAGSTVPKVEDNV
ncbi:alkaline phosphatase [Massilia arenosa]|uniref:Alkaline phosphatase n=1 Tax=Zemynaea arenosa TaxID=2561931 RepID=A0A4Y9SK21_9BURK|nr:alkaline phosphatase D family protein [Massilia arenosa]TFW22816.1 alkaline phosphatase [Massilia arenosa]